MHNFEVSNIGLDGHVSVLEFLSWNFRWSLGLEI